MTVEEYRQQQDKINALVDKQVAAAEAQRRGVALSHVLTELAASGTVQY